MANHSLYFSMVFLAMAATLLLTDQAQGRIFRFHGRRAGGVNLCRRADYPAVCRSVVRGITNPYLATRKTVLQLVAETKKAKRSASRLRRSQVVGVCKENYDDALSDLATCLVNLKTHDKGSFNSYLSAALTDYDTCDDAFSEMGIRSPLQKTNTRLRQIASTGLYLATKFR